MKSMVKILGVLAVVVAFAAPASADPWKNVDNSFVVGFSDNYVKSNPISWNLVAQSFETGFNDNYVKPSVDSRVQMAEIESVMDSEQYINNVTIQFGIYQKIADLNWDYNLNRA
jgi:hypothetical protein